MEYSCRECIHSYNNDYCCLFDELILMENICPYYHGGHNKYHEKYGVECSIKNLLELKEAICGSNHKKLKKENKRLKKTIKHMVKLAEDSE